MSNSTSSDNGDVAGNYTLTGKNLAGQAYDGTLTIKNQDEVYRFSWNVGGSAYDGVGVRDGNLMAVGYGAGEDGKGCGGGDLSNRRQDFGRQNRRLGFQ